MLKERKSIMFSGTIIHYVKYAVPAIITLASILVLIHYPLTVMLLACEYLSCIILSVCGAASLAGYFSKKDKDTKATAILLEELNKIVSSDSELAEEIYQFTLVFKTTLKGHLLISGVLISINLMCGQFIQSPPHNTMSLFLKTVTTIPSCIAICIYLDKLNRYSEYASLCERYNGGSRP